MPTQTMASTEPRLNRLNGSTTRRAPQRRRQTKRTADKRLAGSLAVAAGCTTPAAALAMSTITGHVATVSPLMAAAPFGILACLLVVSTPHVAEAKRCIGWARWQSWAFAIALDAAIVVCEMLHVWCPLPEISWLPTTVICGAVVYSALLNIYVNLRHAKIVR